MIIHIVCPKCGSDQEVDTEEFEEAPEEVEIEVRKNPEPKSWVKKVKPGDPKPMWPGKNFGELLVEGLQEAVDIEEGFSKATREKILIELTQEAQHLGFYSLPISQLIPEGRCRITAKKGKLPYHKWED